MLLVFSPANHDSTCTYVLALSLNMRKFNKFSIPSTFADWTALLILFTSFSSLLLLFCFWSRVRPLLHQIPYIFNFPITPFILLFPMQVTVFVHHSAVAGYQVLTFPFAYFSLCSWNSHSPFFSHYFRVLYRSQYWCLFHIWLDIFKHWTPAYYRPQKSCYYLKRFHISQSWVITTLRWHFDHEARSRTIQQFISTNWPSYTYTQSNGRLCSEFCSYPRFIPFSLLQYFYSFPFWFIGPVLLHPSSTSPATTIYPL